LNQLQYGLNKTWEENKDCKNYLNLRSISTKTIKEFRIGYSYNSKQNLYNHLKSHSFDDKDILKSNLVKIDQNNNYKDFFYKRIIFPISNEFGKVVGFGGRVINNSNPKYINSPESDFFKKRYMLYNLDKAKKNIRMKNNMLVCEGYMDVISLFEKNIKTAVAPLGTAFTEEQLNLCWKYVNKPTIMFDSDTSGIRAAYKSALMSLPFISPNKFIQFINLPKGYDPDSFINEFSINEFASLLKEPTQLINFIFDQSSSSIDLSNTDNKIVYDKYIDETIQTIKDTKIRYFYKNEIKNLFFNKIKTKK
jgi:DNA primase (bacterial type)